MASMLEGVRVVELGTVITGPLAGQLLGDLGADVIKVEPPEGDPFRRTHGDDYGPTFLAYNRNKRSIVLDLRTQNDRTKLSELVADADVLLDNFRPGVLEKLGLAPTILRERHPCLIQCSITGFGPSGPYAKRPAFDGIAQALGGIASLMIDPEDPLAFGPTISDNVTGMYACYAILGALVERARTGRGRRVEVNMLEATMAFIPDSFTNHVRSGQRPDRFTRVAVSQSFALRCADGTAIAIHLSTREKFWQALINAAGAEELAADPRFATHRDRARNYKALQQELATRFAERTRESWMAILSSADLPFAPILGLDEVLEDPQVRHLSSVGSLVHPAHGSVEAVRCPVLVDGMRPDAANRAPPTLGEHNTEILGH